MRTLLFFIMVLQPFLHSLDPLEKSSQLLVVTTDGWDEVQGNLNLFERSENGWAQHEQPIPVVVGQKGMGWGIGLHPEMKDAFPLKIEGDKKSPAGIFSIGSAFGFSPMMLHMDYLVLDDDREAVDDPSSRYYNFLIKKNEVPCDLKSSEKMKEVSLYKYGFVVNHNFPNPIPGKGSCIFFHIWRNPEKGTLGCTAMSEENIKKILFWIDAKKNPLLVQLPHSVYVELETLWNLPRR